MKNSVLSILSLLLSFHFANASSRTTLNSANVLTGAQEAAAESDEDDNALHMGPQAEVEYEPLAANGKAAKAVRKDGLSQETIDLINTAFELWGTLPNPLKEADARRLKTEVSSATSYYIQNGGGVSSIPGELKVLSRRANTLYQNTANEKPVSPPAKLEPEVKKDICDHYPNGLKAFYEAVCLKD